MKTLLIGADGLLGSYWLKKFSELYPSDEIKGTTRRTSAANNKIFLELTKTGMSEFESSLNTFRPEAVIYLAGVTNVDECERNKDLALDMNAHFPAQMAAACKNHSIKFLYISTDHLFGDSGSFFSEEEPTVLVNYYAYSKKLAEDLILKNNPQSLIVRTNFYGKSIAIKPSFTDWIEQNLKDGTEIKMGDDIYFNPVFMGDLVKASHLLLDKNQSGIFNITSDDRISKYDFATTYAKFFGLNFELIKPFNQKEYPREVRRPFEMSLSNAKMTKMTGMHVGKILDGFEKLKKERSII